MAPRRERQTRPPHHRLLPLFDAEETATLREDRERPSLTNAEAVANAPVTSGGYYKVPRVIER